MGKREVDYYVELCDLMEQEDRERDRFFEAYEMMYHCQWSLPDEIEKLEWIRKYVSTDFFDAVSAGTKVLCAREPKFKFQPLAPNQESKNRANEIERILSWNLDCVNQRREDKVEADMARSALLYSIITANVVDLDWQFKQMEAIKADTRRLKAMRRYGRFMVNTFNPRSVHVRRSRIMPEGVLLVQDKTVYNILDEWGEWGRAAIEGMKKINGKDAADKYTKLRVYDYMDYDVHIVYILEGTGEGNPVLIIPEKEWEHKLSFLPWVAAMGGTALESDQEHKYKPMGYSVYLSDQWKTQNLIKTIRISETLARAVSPRFTQEGGNPTDSTDVDYTDPAHIAKPPIGASLKELNPSPGEPALKELDMDISSEIYKSTLARVLMGGDFPAGTAFALGNLQMQTALGSLRPAKDLAERGVAEVGRLMLLWCEFTGAPLDGYGRDKRSDMGHYYKVEPDEIDPGSIYIKVELSDDLPTDRQQKANTAAFMVQALNYPQEYALEEMGVTDPDTAIKQRTFEKLFENEIAMMIEQQKMQLQMQAAAQQAQMQMMMQQQAMQQQVMQQQAAMQGGMGMAQMQGENGIPAGAPFNAAQGGMPTAMAMPGATREMVTGQDLRGGAVATPEEMA